MDYLNDYMDCNFLIFNLKNSEKTSFVFSRIHVLIASLCEQAI